MLSEKILFALNAVDDSFLEEARMLMDGPAAVQQSGRKRTVRVFLIAAILAALMGASAYAVKTSVASPEAAKKVALQEIEVWKEMGLLSPDICFEGEPNNIVEIEEKQANDYWYGRLFTHSYDVRWHLGPADWVDQIPPENLVQRKYGCNLRVDTPYEASLAATDVSLVDGREREREFYTLVVQCSGIHHILCDTVDLRDLLCQEGVAGVFVEVRDGTANLIIKEGEVESYV